MLFNSLDYIVFLFVVFALFWSFEPTTSAFARALVSRGPRSREAWLRFTRCVLLLIASCLFYMSWNATFILLLMGATLVDYAAGLALGRVETEWKRKAILGVSLLVNLGSLGIFKYADFGLVASSDVLHVFGVDWQPTLLHLILPVGISFYSFQTLSYTIDVYRRRLAPHRDPIEFATYVAFFPQLVAGPIVRASEFLPQFANRPRLSAAGAQSAIYLIVRGMVKKVAIADFLAAHLIDRVFENPGTFSAAEVWVAVYAYTWQLYGDFSGYTDIARGSARLFGFELPENFDRPFNTTGPIEFWRCWHITLSRWVQDYLYIPLGGSKKGRGRTYLNLFLSFLIIGLWHGAGWTFVLFGLWHAVGVTVNRLYRDWRKSRGLDATPPERSWKRALLVFINLHFFVIHWPIFRSPSIERMTEVYRQMWAGDWLSVRIEPGVWAVIIGMGLTHFCPREWVERAEDRIREMPWPFMGVLVAAIAALLMLVSAGQAAPFIYFQF